MEDPIQLELRRGSTHFWRSGLISPCSNFSAFCSASHPLRASPNRLLLYCSGLRMHFESFQCPGSVGKNMAPTSDMSSHVQGLLAKSRSNTVMDLQQWRAEESCSLISHQSIRLTDAIISNCESSLCTLPCFLYETNVLSRWSLCSRTQAGSQEQVD